MTTPKKGPRAAEYLDEILARYNALSPEQKREVEKLAEAVTGDMRWVPNPGAQTLAYYGVYTADDGTTIQIDQLLYGGRAAGGKTDVLIALALQVHKRSLLRRRMNNEVHFLVDRAEEIVGHRNGYNGSDHRWYLEDRLVMFGGCQHEGDELKYRGEPKSFVGIDEASGFHEVQIDRL